MYPEVRISPGKFRVIGRPIITDMLWTLFFAACKRWSMYLPDSGEDSFAKLLLGKCSQQQFTICMEHLGGAIVFEKKYAVLSLYRARDRWLLFGSLSFQSIRDKPEGVSEICDLLSKAKAVG
jgi:hypothetical protein